MHFIFHYKNSIYEHKYENPIGAHLRSNAFLW